MLLKCSITSCLDAEDRWEKLLTASLSPLWFALCHFTRLMLMTYASNCAISVELDSQIAFELLGLGYPLCMGNWMICDEKRHILLLK